MRTRLVRVRRDRPSGLVWALAGMIFSLSLYLLSLAPPVKEVLRQSAAEGAVAPRLTEEVAFAPLDCCAIQFGAYENAAAARVEAARYVKRGAAGYVLTDGEIYRVLGACYDEQSAAKSVLEKLLENESMEAALYAVEGPGVTLRVTAAREQIDALGAAERTLREATDELGALAYRLDAGEMPAAEALNVLEAEARAVEAARDRLKSASGEHSNAVAEGLLAVMDEFFTAQSQLLAENHDTVLSFSSRIKYNTLDTRIRHAAYLRALAP